jgi:putative ABC transport system ATP-binding protein
VEPRGVRHSYGRPGPGTAHALRGIDLTLPRGTFTAVTGPSGSGKCATGLDLPTEGTVRLGFVFQASSLPPPLTAELLARGGLEGKGGRRPAELSGGRQQCVAVARALVTRSDVVFADEPTGALGTTTAGEVLGLFRDAVDSLGATVVRVTRAPTIAPRTTPLTAA